MTHEQHHNVSSLVSDLVQMAEATRRLPEIEGQLRMAHAKLEEQRDAVMHRELRIIDLKTENDELRAKLREVESERDDAGFRELEAQDKVVSLSAAIAEVISGLAYELGKADGSDKTEALRMTVEERRQFAEWQRFNAEMEAKREAERQAALARPFEEPSPVEALSTGSIDSTPEGGSTSAEPIAEPIEVLATSVEGKEYADPITDVVKSTGDIPSTDVGLPIAQPQGDALTVGQSEPLPTVASPIVASTAASTLADALVVASSPLPTAGQSDADPTVHTSPEPVNSTTATLQGGAAGPYFGKRYYNWPALVSRDQWLAGGGTNEDYDWSPAAFNRASHMS